MLHFQDHHCNEADIPPQMGYTVLLCMNSRIHYSYNAINHSVIDHLPVNPEKELSLHT